MLKCVGYSILSLLTRKGYHSYSSYDMWVTMHRTSSSYEPDTTKLIFILNQKVQ